MKQNSLGKRLQVLREKSGLTAREVARSLGVSESTYRDWEHGRAISGEPYVQLAQLFGISLHELFTGESKYQDVATHLGQVKSSISALEDVLRTLPDRDPQISKKE